MNNCQWHGHGDGCDQQALPAQSYCQQHYARVYQQGTALSRRPKDQRRAAQTQITADLFDQCVAELEQQGLL